MDENENSCERAFHCNGSIFPTSQVAFGFKFNSFFNSLNVLRGYFTQKLAKLATDKLTGYCENDWILLNGKIKVLLNLNLSIQEINLKTSASHVLHWKAFNSSIKTNSKKFIKSFLIAGMHILLNGIEPRTKEWQLFRVCPWPKLPSGPF